MSKRRRRRQADIEQPIARSPFWMRALGYFAIVIVAIIAFAPLRHAGFVSMDDPGTISANKQLDSPGHFWTHAARGLYVPVTYTFWSMLAVFARDPITQQLDPGVFHVANVFIHVVTSLIVAAILRVLVKRDAPAILGALVFAVHPLQVETIAWASGSKDLLAGMIGLAALLIHLLRARSLIPNRLAFAAGVFASVLLTLALLSKPSAMTIPAIALVIDRLVIGRDWRTVLKSLALWFALALACAIIAWMAQPAFRADEIPLWARPLLVGDAITFYLWKLIAPFNLAVCYGRIVPDLMMGKWLFLAWIVPASLVALAFRTRKRSRIPVAALLIFIIAPAPLLGLFRFDYQYFSTVADHYIYVAMLGPALLIAWMLSRNASRIWCAIAAILIVALTIASNQQSRIWRDDFSLFTHSVKVAPRGVLTLHNLGNWYESKEDRPRAVEMYEDALAVRPHHYESMGALAGTLARMGREEESLTWFRKFLEHEGALPDSNRPKQYADHLFTFAQMRLRAGDWREAAVYFRKVLEVRPNDPVAARDLRIAEQQRESRATTKASQ